MKMSHGKDGGLPHRSSGDSSLKLFGRTIPISVSQDLMTLKHGKSSDSRQAGECRALDPKQEEKSFKKPEKIVQCPRCDSYDTKFCYFNNYNVNQPRHFCKKCHRYWTAGGTMRNVPVGAGRRRNKHLASQFCLENATQIECSNQFHRPPNSNADSNTNILTFGLEKLVPKAMDPPMEEPSTTGSSITTGSNAMNEFSKPNGIACSRAKEYPCHVSPPDLRWHPPATVYSGNHGASGSLEGRREVSVVVPKTLRLDYPEEASKSPIWASLGFDPFFLQPKF